MRKNKIIYAGGFGLPDLNASAQRALENAKLFGALGYEVSVLGKIFQQPPGNSEQAQSVHDFEGVKCLDIRHANGSVQAVDYTKDISTVKHAVEAVGTDRVHAIVAYNYPPLALYKINNFARRNGIGTIAECTEWHGFEGKKILRNIIRQLQTEARMRFVAPRTGNVICASRFLQSRYTRQNTVVLPFVVDKHASKWRPEAASRAPGPRRFVYVGSPGLGMFKDLVHEVIRAFALVHEDRSDFEFVVVGITEQEILGYFPELETVFSTLEGHIKCKGRVSHEAAVMHMARADYSVFLRPLNRISAVGFPTKVAEAFACGIPTITNRTSDIDQYVIHGENGFLLDCPDHHELAGIIQEALDLNDEQLARMKRQCREGNPFHFEYYKDAVGEFLRRVN